MGVEEGKLEKEHLLKININKQPEIKIEMPIERENRNQRWEMPKMNQQKWVFCILKNRNRLLHYEEEEEDERQRSVRRSWRR